MKHIILLLSMALCPSGIVNSQNLTATELIQKSINYHDPTGTWESFQDTLRLLQENPKKETRRRLVTLDRLENKFSFRSDLKDGLLEYKVLDNEGKAYWNGSESIPDSIGTKHRISPERAKMYRNYYSYLYGMPMKLNDPGTIIQPAVEEVLFHDKEYYKITVTYEEAVGSDTWYFYFDKNTYALGAYEFWKKKPGDGEYLLLEGIKEIDKIKLPHKVAWYMTVDDRWLGTDVLE